MLGHWTWQWRMEPTNRFLTYSSICPSDGAKGVHYWGSSSTASKFEILKYSNHIWMAKMYLDLKYNVPYMSRFKTSHAKYKSSSTDAYAAFSEFTGQRLYIQYKYSYWTDAVKVRPPDQTPKQSWTHTQASLGMKYPRENKKWPGIAMENFFGRPLPHLWDTGHQVK